MGQDTSSKIQSGTAEKVRALIKELTVKEYIKSSVDCWTYWARILQNLHLNHLKEAIGF